MHKLMIMLLAGLVLAACGQQPDDQQYADKMAEEYAGDAPVPSPATEIPPAMTVAQDTVVYAEIEGQAIEGYLVWPAETHGALPGVLVFHEWWGLNDNIRAMADQLAGQGYVVLAVDLYSGKVAQTPEQARSHMQAALAQPAALNDNLRQAYKFLEEQTAAVSIGTLGWCFGGSLSLRAALLHPDKVDATVIYYGHVADTPKEDLAALQMPILGLFGAADQGIPVESVREFDTTLKSLGKNVEIHIYEGAGHAFANPSGQNYRPEAAQDAWRKSLAFFDRYLNPTGEALPSTE